MSKLPRLTLPPRYSTPTSDVRERVFHSEQVRITNNVDNVYGVDPVYETENRHLYELIVVPSRIQQHQHLVLTNSHVHHVSRKSDPVISYRYISHEQESPHKLHLSPLPEETQPHSKKDNRNQHSVYRSSITSTEQHDGQNQCTQKKDQSLRTVSTSSNGDGNSPPSSDRSRTSVSGQDQSVPNNDVHVSPTQRKDTFPLLGSVQQHEELSDRLTTQRQTTTPYPLSQEIAKKMANNNIINGGETEEDGIIEDCEEQENSEMKKQRRQISLESLGSDHELRERIFQTRDQFFKQKDEQIKILQTQVEDYKCQVKEYKCVCIVLFVFFCIYEISVLICMLLIIRYLATL